MKINNRVPNPNSVLKLALSVAIASFATIKYLTVQLADFRAQFSSQLLPWDSFYTTRIFSINSTLINNGSHLANRNGIETPSLAPFTLPETIMRLAYFASDQNLVITYYLASYVILFFWILVIMLITKEVENSKKIVKLFLTCSLLVIFFGNAKLVHSEYGFARIISPQFHILFWLVFLLILKKYYSRLNHFDGFRNMYLVFGIAALVSSNSYPFLFLCVIATIGLLLIQLLSLKKWMQAINLLSFAAPGIVFFLSIELERRTSIGSLEAAERHGLLNSRVPGALYANVVCLVILIYIWSRRKVWIKQNQQGVNFSLSVSSIAIILASQSNLLTSKSVQFSDHFDNFANANLVVLILNELVSFSVPRNLEIIKKAKNLPKFALTVLSIVLVLVQADLTRNLLLLSDVRTKSQTPIEFRGTNVIVDLQGQRDFFTSFYDVKVLFDGSVFLYGFENLEVLNRYSLTKGCKRLVEADLSTAIVGYSIDASLQKAERIKSLTGEMTLGHLFGAEARKLQLVANERRDNWLSLISYLNSIDRTKCLEKIFDYEVKAVIFDEESEWNELAERFELQVGNWSDTSFKYVKISPKVFKNAPSA